jgi:SAM-dependent methyltransferase
VHSLCEVVSAEAPPSSERSGAALEQITCNLCGGDDTRLRYDFAPLRIVQCRRCGLVYTSPRPVADPAEIYDEAFWAAYEAGYERELAAIRHTFRLWIDELAARFDRPNLRIVELGSGLGAFLAEARALGHDVLGIEPSPHARKYARERFGLETVAGRAETLAEISVPAADVFVMLATIEHLSDPFAVLREAQRMVVPGGLVFLSTGVWGCFNHRIAGKRWTIIAPRGHLYYFSKRTCAALLQQAGFEPIRLTTNGALVNTLTDSPRLVRLFNNRLTDELRVGWFVSKLKLGDEMFVTARRLP